MTYKSRFVHMWCVCLLISCGEHGQTDPTDPADPGWSPPTGSVEAFVGAVSVRFPGLRLTTPGVDFLGAPGEWVESSPLLAARAAPTTATVSGDLTAAARELSAAQQRVGARLGPMFHEGAAVSLGTSETQRVSFRPVAPLPTHAVVWADRVLYPGAWPSTDVLYQATTRQLKELIVLRDARAPRSLSFKMTVGPALHVRASTSGDFDLVDGEQIPRLRVERPFVIDAEGDRRDLDWSVDGDTWTLHLPADLSYPAAVDPVIGTPTWTQLVLGTATVPSARIGAAMAFDANRNKVVLFGGDDGAVNGETYDWDASSNTWTLRLPANSPTARSFATMAYDRIRGKPVLFGGTMGSGPSQATFEFDSTFNANQGDWAQLTSTSNPSQRTDMRMVQYVDATQANDRLFLFGGCNNLANGNACSAELWEWNGNTNQWKLATTSGGPPSARHGMGMAMRSNQIVMFGGATAQTANANSVVGETWVWTYTQASDSGSWAQNMTAGQPSARMGAAMATYGSRQNKIVIFGGDTDNSNGAQPNLLNDTMEFDGTSWYPVTVTSPSSGRRADGPMVYDTSNGTTRMLQFGGRSGTGATTEQTTWEYKVVNTAPTANNQSPTTNEDTALPITLTGSDPDGDTITFAIGTGPTNGVLSGSPPNVTYTPNSQFNGSDSFTFTTSDSLLTSAAATVSITVSAVNDAPVNNVPGTQTINEDATLTFTGGTAISVTDVDVGTGNLGITLTMTNGTLALGSVANLISLTGNGTGLVTFSGQIADVNTALNNSVFTPTSNFNGSASVQIATSDNGNTGSGGTKTDTDTVNITVTAVNDAPVNSVPGAQIINEDNTFTFTGGNAISVADVDVGGGNLTITLTITNGTFTLGGTAGLSGLVGNGTGSVAFSGTLANVNTALNNSTFTPTPNFNGSANVQIATSDNGNTGTGGTKTDTDSVAITVNAVNDAPVDNVPGTQTINEDTNLTFTGGTLISVTDVDAASGTMSIALTATNGILTLSGTTGLSGVTGNGTASVSFSGTLAACNTAMNGMVFAPTLNFNGAASVSITSSDNGNTGSGGTLMDSDTVNITINAVNDPPVWTATGTQTFVEGVNKTFTVVATDVDDVTLTYAMTSGPTGATFTPATRTFSWTPGCKDADNGPNYSAVFTVTDGHIATPVSMTVSLIATGVVVSPQAIVFPATRAGDTTTPANTVTITNTAATVNIQNISTGTNIFPVSNVGTLPRSLPGPAGSTTAQVAFHPLMGIAYNDTMTVLTDDANCPMNTIALSGQGQDADVSIVPASRDFPDVRVGAAGADTTFTVTNTGAAMFKVVSTVLADITNFTLTDTNSYQVTLNPGNTMTFKVKCNPASVGLKSSTVTVTTDIPGKPPIPVALTCTGVSPIVSASEASIAFGPVDVQGAPATNTLTLTNTGGFPMQITSGAISGTGAARYAITSGTIPQTVAANGGTAVFTIRYTPIMESAGDSATLTIHTDADNMSLGSTNVVLPITGRGIDRHLTLSATTLAFPAVIRNGTADLPLTIGNTGEAAMALVGPSGSAPLQLSGTGATSFSVVAQPTSPLAGAGQTVVTVRFHPVSAGSFTATLSIFTDDNDFLPRAQVTLTGSGTLAALLVTPADLTSNVVPVGVTRRLDQTARVVNMGSAPIRVSNVCVASGATNACDTTSTFSVTGFDGAVTLQPAESRDYGVTFAPTAAQTFTARILVFAEDDPDPEYFVNLNGEGIDDVELSGGGCAVAPGGSGSGDAPLAGLVVVGVFALALRPRRKALLLVGLLLVAPARADNTDTSFDLGVFHPTTAGSGSFINVERPLVLNGGDLGFGVTVDFAKNPLYARRAGMPGADTPVSSRSEMILVVGYGIGGRAEVGLALPVLSQSGTVSMTGVNAASGMAVGDLQLGGRLRLVTAGRLSLAASAALAVPTGDANQYAGTGSIGAEARLIAGLDVGKLRLAANAGYHLRGRVDVMGELYGAVGSSSAATPVEGILGLRWWPTSRIALTGGGGTGLHAGVGAADVRVFASLSYAVDAEGKIGRLNGLPGGDEDDGDLDRDGIPNYKDRCPDTPEDKDGFQDEDGCPDPDNDKDGVLDADDKCPNQPGPKENHGCPAVDTDGDGVPDYLDKCPNDPEDKDGFQDADGCPELDNDGDGIPDIIDKCPNDPETINGIEDDDGCPDKGDSSVMLVPDRIEILAPVSFGGNTEVLAKSSWNVLSQVAATMRIHPEIKLVRINSYVDKRGDTMSDYRLSEKRGNSVKKFLTEHGVEATRIEVKPFGSSKPLGSRDLNDRVEFVIMQSEKTK